MKIRQRYIKKFFISIIILLFVSSFISFNFVKLAFSEKGITYPTKAVTFIVPWPPGGRTDLTSRVIAPYLKKYLGQPVVIANKPGASGVIGSKEVARAKNDGYTLGFFSIGFVTTQFTMDTPTDLKEYEPITMVNFDPAALAVSADSPWNNVKEFVNFAKKNPEKINNGNAGKGSGSHIFSEAFSKAAGIKLTQIPFKGDSEATVALAGGHVKSQFAVPIAFKSLADAGKIRILGIASEKRNPLYPEIPTFKEYGVNLVIGSWHGLFAPKDTPSEIITLLDEAMKKAMDDSELIAHMKNSYLGIMYKKREDFKKFLENESNTLGKLIEELGLRVSPRK